MSAHRLISFEGVLVEELGMDAHAPATGYSFPQSGYLVVRRSLISRFLPIMCTLSPPLRYILEKHHLCEETPENPTRSVTPL